MQFAISTSHFGQITFTLSASLISPETLIGAFVQSTKLSQAIISI
jgi:hypothetical protein